MARLKKLTIKQAPVGEHLEQESAEMMVGQALALKPPSLQPMDTMRHVMRLAGVYPELDPSKYPYAADHAAMMLFALLPQMDARDVLALERLAIELARSPISSSLFEVAS